jgi:succinate dehydrogenase / fumarate reductase flavoprotein subunit
MYDQFKELADVDITAGPMEVGPTAHYMMGGIRVDADSGATITPGLYAAGEVAAGLHGSNRLGGNSLTDLLVFGRRAGEAASAAATSGSAIADLPADFVAESLEAMAAPFERGIGEDPYRLHADLQETMSSLVGIFRTGEELTAAIARIEGYKRRWHGLAVGGPRRFNPAWDLVFELRNMLTVSEVIARSALERTESRGAHSRLDHPGTHEQWDSVNVATRSDGEAMVVRQTPTAAFPAELRQYVTPAKE